LVDTSEIIAMMDNNPLLSGITLTGGEPFCQSVACAELAEAAQMRGLSVWAYTGYIYEDIVRRFTPTQLRFLRAIDVLVDGSYIEALRTLDIPFRGSRNQRLINVKQSLSTNCTVEWSEMNGSY
jgi:anaerobic ribonucleoside-triphosphate reductase activating protein